MLISWDIETFQIYPSLLCKSCGGEDFSEEDENGFNLGGLKLMCVGCNEVGDRYFDFATDWKSYTPLGISCAAAAYLKPDGTTQRKFWHGQRGTAMTKAENRAMLTDLTTWMKAGHTIVTWNGLSFDWAVLAEEAGMLDECSGLALRHTDLMFCVVAEKGYRLGLDAALAGAVIESKLHEVTLRDGTKIEGMSGAMAPKMWQDGEMDAVLDYLGADVDQTVRLAHAVLKRRGIAWTSKTKRKQLSDVRLTHDGRLPSVADCLQWRVPSTSWMPNPVPREDYFSWINPKGKE